MQEIVAWLKAHPVSALSRSSCDLQILDAAIVEKIEEEVEKCKVHTWCHCEQELTKKQCSLYLQFLNLNKTIEDYLPFQRKRTQNIM